MRSVGASGQDSPQDPHNPKQPEHDQPYRPDNGSEYQPEEKQADNVTMPVCLSFDCQGLSLLQVESFPLDLLQPPCLLSALVFGKHAAVLSSVIPVEQFFERTGRDYERFNYLGEWHSHPSFTTRPSRSDVRSMYRIVSEPSVGANFAALVIVRLAARAELEMSACVFRPGQPVVGARIYRGHLGSKLRDWKNSWFKSNRWSARCS
jgi:hypothetical protein